MNAGMTTVVRSSFLLRARDGVGKAGADGGWQVWISLEQFGAGVDLTAITSRDPILHFVQKKLGGGAHAWRNAQLVHQGLADLEIPPATREMTLLRVDRSLTRRHHRNTRRQPHDPRLSTLHRGARMAVAHERPAVVARGARAA